MLAMSEGAICIETYSERGNISSQGEEAERQLDQALIKQGHVSIFKSHPYTHTHMYSIAHAI